MNEIMIPVYIVLCTILVALILSIIQISSNRTASSDFVPPKLAYVWNLKHPISLDKLTYLISTRYHLASVYDTSKEHHVYTSYTFNSPQTVQIYMDESRCVQLQCPMSTIIVVPRYIRLDATDATIHYWTTIPPFVEDGGAIKDGAIENGAIKNMLHILRSWMGRRLKIKYENIGKK